MTPDAQDTSTQQLFQDRIKTWWRRSAAIRPASASQDAAENRLLPYQLDGIAFAAGAGRAILADDMGLGKTIQGVGVAELLAREAEIRKVLVVCPASLKSQWRNEIQRFCGRDANSSSARPRARGPVRDEASSRSATTSKSCGTSCIERVPWDLIILDEGQRIKNWEAKTSRVIRLVEPLCAGAVRHAAGEPAGRTVLRRAVHRRSPAGPGVPLLQSPPGGRRERQGARLPEPGRAAGEPEADPAAPHARLGVRQELPPRTTEIVRIRRPTNSRSCTPPICRRWQIMRKKY